MGRRIIIIDDDSTEKSGKLIDCPICKGTGIDYTTAVFGKPCENCKKTGKIRV